MIGLLLLSSKHRVIASYNQVSANDRWAKCFNLPSLRRYWLPACACLMLNGCLGGPIAQQIASSLLMHAADKLAEQASNAYDARQLKKELDARSIKLEDTPPDPYWAAFVTSNFAPAPADSFSSQAENQQARAKYIWPQQERWQPQQAAEADASDSAQAESSHLVQVEVWNLLIGSEKLSVLHKAQQMGSAQLPQVEDWSRWQVATGALKGDQKKLITFLIPPEYGKLSSGELAVVEITSVGGLHIARYAAN